MLQTLDTTSPAMTLWTRWEHGNRPVRVFQGGEGTRYVIEGAEGDVEFGSAKAMLESLYGRDLHVPFDRYFRIGRYRRAGRHSAADLLTLLDANDASDVHQTLITVHHEARKADPVLEGPRSTAISVSRGASEPPKALGNLSVGGLGGVSDSPDPIVADLIRAVGEEIQTQGDIPLTPEMERELDEAIRRDLDRIAGVVGIDLGGVSSRSGSRTKADEVRRLLWKGFAGKMLSRGYDPEDVLQEVYRGLLVRNRGKCPWDARKSTFGHYCHLVIGCVLINYHRKVTRRTDYGAISIDRDGGGEDRADSGVFGSRQIWEGTDIGDRLALERLARHLDALAEDLPDAVLGRAILPLLAAGHTRQEIARITGARSPLVSQALAWLRERVADWAVNGGMAPLVPAKYLS
jgi:DNA-directed RNA polymerase specialized sigma24 family protein